MRFLFFVLFLGVAQATYTYKTNEDYRDVLHTKTNFGEFINVWNKRDLRIPVDRNLAKIQMEIIRLLDNINHLCTDRVVLDISKTYRLEDRIDNFLDKDVVVDLIRFYRNNGFLGRDKVLNIHDKVHRQEVMLITRVLMTAKDLNEFFKCACWLRNKINGGVFTYVLTFAVKNRDDCVGIVLPAIYEIKPYKFFRNKVIQKALQLKMQGEVFDDEYARKLGVTKIGKDVFVIDTHYTGTNIDNNGESKLTYFTEDIGLNGNYYMHHVTQPFWVNYDFIKTTRHNDLYRGKWFIFIHQQLLARYYMERLSNGLGEIPPFKLNTLIKTGYNPSLRHHNGLEYSTRPNNFVVNTEENIWDIKTFKDHERRIRDAIDRGYFWTEEGNVVSLRKIEDLDVLGNLLNCNGASMNRRFFCGFRRALRILGNVRVTDDNTGVAPTVLDDYATKLRDPVYFQLMKRIMHNVYKFTDKLRPYTIDELLFKGIVVGDVKVDKLVTFFDNFDVDITNVVNRNVEEMKQNVDRITILARQPRLNHIPFDVKIDIKSDVTTDCLVKIFLGPKYDGLKRKIQLNDNRKNFILLDNHVVTLKKGINVITRNSRMFNLFIDDKVTTKRLIHRVDKCLKGEEECFTLVRRPSVIIPDRLALPKGTVDGMKFQLFVTVTPLNTGKLIETFRYPLDRNIYNVVDFLRIDNFFLRDVTIYHKKGITDTIRGTIRNDNVMLNGKSSESRSDESASKEYITDDFLTKRTTLGLNKFTTGRTIDFLNKKHYDTLDNSFETQDLLNRKLYTTDDFLTKRHGKTNVYRDNTQTRRNILDSSLESRSLESDEFLGRRNTDRLVNRRLNTNERKLTDRVDTSIEDSRDITNLKFLRRDILDKDTLDFDRTNTDKINKYRHIKY